MHIKLVEVQNFRKLKSVRIEFDTQKTIFVGANNSGKTSAMVALRYFLVKPEFSLNDFTLSNWKIIADLGQKWDKELASKSSSYVPALNEWVDALPALDVWLNVKPDEIHRVVGIIPTLSWKGGDLGVRLRLEPKDIAELYKEYGIARNSCQEVLLAAQAGKSGTAKYEVPLWPSTMQAYLEKCLNDHFAVRAYVLDSLKLAEPVGMEAKPQILPADSLYIQGNPFAGLIRIDEINAQRAFAQSDGATSLEEEHAASTKRPLSAQLRSYYKKHVDPSEYPDAKDIDALEAIHQAQETFDKKLRESLSATLDEVEKLNYPGISNPEIKLSSRLRPVDGINHESALQYAVPFFNSQAGQTLPLLPEHYNGLGYQNLLSMAFKLIGFRDSWMRVGKISKRQEAKPAEEIRQEPLHLVLIEEPEAHLHVQVQQIFIREAYKILRNHPDLIDKEILTTQLIVSTHSSNVAHECEYASLRYFRRILPSVDGHVPVTSVINLTGVFGEKTETQRFVRRYLRAMHCDLFFADAAILVEGSAERILLPNFIRNSFSQLHSCYITILEIDGSHAHTLRPLIELLGLTTLIITDLDSASPSGYHVAVAPARNKKLISRNFTLKDWIPGTNDLDKLLDAQPEEKIKLLDPSCSVRVAYQTPITVNYPAGGKAGEALSTTFEDALILSNLTFFTKERTGKQGEEIVTEYAEIIKAKKTTGELSEAIVDHLRSSSHKARFALDLLFLEDFKELNVPAYIEEGLNWLQAKLVPQKLATHKKATASAEPSKRAGK